MKIALGQINPIIGDIEGNKKKILECYLEGVNRSADLVVLPELAICGYPPLDLIEKRGFRNRVLEATKDLASKTNSVGLIFGTITEYDGDIGTGVYNSAVLCVDGHIRFTQHKSLIPNYDVFDEVRYFEPASDVDIIEFKGEKLGISICEDIWNDKDFWKNRRYINDPVDTLISKEASLLINISASPYSYGRRKERSEMLSSLAQTDNVPIVYACCVGAQTELIFDGASMCFDAKGNLCELGKAFEEDFIFFDTNEDYTPVKSCEDSFEEEVLKALISGLKDYANKTGFKEALIGLSGGIDSAIVTYIAAEALGSENVHVVMMPSQYSSEGSIKDSEKLINNLNISSDLLSVEPVFNKALEVLNPVFKGKVADVTEENLQSRIRGLYLMALSNKFGYLLCTTGNKSEMAVGYATLYGDMNGALGIISDVYKTDVYRICNYINREKEIIPYEIISKAPSAELRPDQKDEDSLPPYDILDKILRMYLEESKEFSEIVKAIDDSALVKKILKLVDLNEFKRKQAAPALRVSQKAFGYGRRFPIVQGWRRLPEFN